MFQNISKRLLVLIILIVIMMPPAVGTYYLYRTRHEKVKANNKMADAANEQLDLLWAEEKELQDAITDFEGRAASAAVPHGTVTLLVTGVQENAREAIDLINAYGYSGVLALSDTSFPDLPGCMTLDEVMKLARAGWELCLTMTTRTDLNALKQAVLDAGLPMPTAVYCPIGSLTVEQRGDLTEAGLTTVIDQSETGHISGGVVTLPAIPGSQMEAIVRMNQAAKNVENIVFCLESDPAGEQYSRETLIVLLREIQAYVKNGDFTVAGCVGAASYNGITEEERAEIDKKREELVICRAKIKALLNGETLEAQ